MSEGPHPGHDPVEVAPYDSRWPRMFETERDLIEAAIGPLVEEVEHVGSTAVPGLAAKPVIDIMVGVRSLDDAAACIEGLQEIGYEYVPEFEREMPERRYLRKFGTGGARTHHIHLIERANYDWWERHLLFRDYLRSDSETAREYGRLKLDLAARFRGDRAGYMDAKSDFVGSVEKVARMESS